MVEILQNKNSATRFRIMVEIAASGPGIPQRSIAARLGVSPQAISDYIKQLTAEGLLEAVDRTSYRVSIRGVSWMLKTLREVNDYVAGASRAVTNITVCAAIAGTDLEAGQTVGLKMENGLLYATAKVGRGARGVAVTSAKRGEDVGLSNIEGVVEFNRGRITVLEVPSIREGGSRLIDTIRLKAQLAEKRQLGAIGIEALAALKQAGAEPHYRYGVAEATIEAARCGASFLIVCSTDAVPGLIKKLQDSQLDYDLVSLTGKKE